MADSKSSVAGFSEAEEAFFSADVAATQPEPVERFADLDEGYQPRPLWRRLFARLQPQR